MRSLTTSFLDRLSFSSRQLDTLTTIGSYQGKQALFEARLPDALVALGESCSRPTVNSPSASER